MCHSKHQFIKNIKCISLLWDSGSYLIESSEWYAFSFGGLFLLRLNFNFGPRAWHNMTQRTQCDPAGAKLRVPVSTFFAIYTQQVRVASRFVVIYTNLFVSISYSVFSMLYFNRFYFYSKKIYIFIFTFFAIFLT